MLALVRPDSWNLPLFLHVLGATILTGGVAATTLAAGKSGASLVLRQVAFRTVIFLVIPAWILMRVAGEWTNSREDIPGDPGWLGTGYIVGDAGVFFLLVTAIGAFLQNPYRRAGFFLADREYGRNMSALPLNLVDTTGFLVADNRGRVVGRVECPMYGTLPDVPDALSVKSGFLSRQRRLVPADTIAEVDHSSNVVALRVPKENVRRFL